MNRLKKFSKILFAGILLAGACVEPYNPPDTATNVDFLVVEGFLNTTNATASVSIRHSIPLSSNLPAQPEQGATVTVLDDQGDSFPLVMDTPGIYTASSVNFINDRKYSLFIQTVGGKRYESDFVELKPTPPIDSVSWEIRNGTLNINVNTHDPTGKSRYYKWSYVETYEYDSKYRSNFILENKWYKERPDSLQIGTCWRTQPQTNITVATTEQLTEDVISNKTVNRIDNGSLKVSKLYSILVQQETISEEAYAYWLNVQKTSESLGGLFDPIPSQVIGNIHSIDNVNEQVIGYFSGGERKEERIYISIKQVHPPFNYLDYGFCQMDTIPLSSITTLSDPNALVYSVYHGIALYGFTTSSPRCIDCRLFGGGITTKPDFWPK
jgi:hypothetical protein